MEKDSEDKEKYLEDLDNLELLKERADKRRKRLHKREWTPMIED